MTPGFKNTLVGNFAKHNASFKIVGDINRLFPGGGGGGSINVEWG